MATDFYLKNPQRGNKNPIFLRVRVRRGGFSFDAKLKTGLTTSIYNPDEWNGIMTNTRKADRYKDSAEEGRCLLDKIEQITANIKKLILMSEETSCTNKMTADDVREAIDVVVKREERDKIASIKAAREEAERLRMEEEKRMTFSKFISKHIESSKNTLRERTIANLKQAQRQFMNFQTHQHREYDFADMDNSFLDAFVGFVKYQNIEITNDDGTKTIEQKERSRNTIAGFVKNLKAMLEEARKQGYNQYQAYRDWEYRFNDADAIYLTDEEVKAIEDVDLSSLSAGYRIARDLFLIGIFSAQRFSDIDAEKMSAAHIETVKDEKGNIIYDNTGKPRRYISLIQKKTEQTALIPLTERLEHLLSKYDFKLPKQANATTNKFIKEVAREAGICSKVTITKHYTKGTKTETVEKWMLIGTHTARRTAITEMYLATKDGQMSVSDIQLVSGHASEKQVKRYVRATTAEKAAKLMKAKFYNK